MTLKQARPADPRWVSSPVQPVACGRFCFWASVNCLWGPPSTSLLDHDFQHKEINIQLVRVAQAATENHSNDERGFQLVRVALAPQVRLLAEPPPSGELGVRVLLDRGRCWIGLGLLFARNQLLRKRHFGFSEGPLV